MAAGGRRRLARPDSPHCFRCGEPITRTPAWLELNRKTNRFSDPETQPVPDGESQGLFCFGPDCAKTVLAQGGEVDRRA